MSFNDFSLFHSNLFNFCSKCLQIALKLKMVEYMSNYQSLSVTFAFLANKNITYLKTLENDTIFVEKYNRILASRYRKHLCSHFNKLNTVMTPTKLNALNLVVT